MTQLADGENVDDTMTECRFCEIIKDQHARIDEDVVFENEEYLGLIDKFRKPSVGLICLLIPKAHIETILDLDEKYGQSLVQTIQLISKSMQSVYKCNGIRIWTATNKEAGQSVPHFHIHIIPCKTNRDRILALIPGGIDLLRRIVRFGKRPIDQDMRSRRAELLRNEIVRRTAPERSSQRF